MTVKLGELLVVLVKASLHRECYSALPDIVLLATQLAKIFARYSLDCSYITAQRWPFQSVQMASSLQVGSNVWIFQQCTIPT